MKKVSVLLFLFLVVSCTSRKPDVSILDNPTCGLPCWNNIVPGETTYSEALQIVSKLDGIDQSKTEDLYAPWKIFSQQIWFYLYTDPSLAKVQTDGAVYFIDDKAAALILQRNVGRTFEEMVKLTGDPETIILMPFPGGPVFMAVVPSKGVKYEFYSKSKELKPETQIDNVMFFDPSQYEALLDAGMFSLGERDANKTREIMQPWKGYGNIQELYPMK